MVTKNELSDFRQTLADSLQKAGYSVYGRIASPAKIYKFYAHLPEEEMIAQYAEDNNLDEINRVYRVISYINENSGNFYSLIKLCKEHEIDYKLFVHVVENLPYIDKRGEKRKTQYYWVHEEEPSYNAAKEIVEHMRKLKLTKLNKTLKQKIKKAVAKGISKDDFFKTNKIKKDATYNAEAYFTYQKMQQQKIDTTDDIPKTHAEEIAQPEASAVSEVELQDPGNVKEQSVQNGEDVLSLSEVPDDSDLQMENYILRQEIKYLKKLNKAKDRLIKALRKKV